MQAILWPIVSWIFREILVKFVVVAGVYSLLVILVPMAVGYVAPFIGTSSLSSVFGGVSDGVYFFLLAFRLDVGAPLLISAYVSRFLIRRLPMIG